MEIYWFSCHFSLGQKYQRARNSKKIRLEVGELPVQITLMLRFDAVFAGKLLACNEIVALSD